eukprot:TRINITY_DN9447_c0_g2_i4.p5 TRINITY_DN9447_c0_g2~~TRINITY_DN9447_c0_g2_i4.p5  ORF type:complete len:145 (+),score=46.29 TRINITY_DN9447_c0_g2_i4:405-839(+)
MQMYRVFYHSSRKATVATTFVRKAKFGEPACIPEDKFLIPSNQPELLDVFMQAGKSIERMEQELRKLCTFLFQAYGLRIEELAADFVKDKRDRYCLVNVRFFKLEERNYNVKKLEHAKLIENQATALEYLREHANDSSNIFLMN